MELGINLNVFTNGDGALVSYHLLCFRAQQVVNKFLSSIHLLGVLENSYRGGNYQEFRRIAHLNVSAFSDLSVGDIVNCQRCSQFAGSGIVDNLAGAFAYASAVSLQLFEEVGAKLFLQQSDGHVSGAGQSGVSYCEAVLEFGFLQVCPLSRSGLNFIGVDDDAQSAQTSCMEGSIIVIKGVNDFLENRALVVSQDAFLLHLVEVRNLTGPDNVSQNLAALTFSSDFSHQLASACRLIVNLNAGVLLFEASNDTFNEGFLHRGINDQFVAISLGSSSLLFAAAAASEEHGTSQYTSHCYDTSFFQHG